MKDSILNLLERNSKLTAEEIALELQLPKAQVEAAIKEMEEDQVICGYTTLINWEKTNTDDVTALIEVKVTPQRGNGFDRIAERIYRFEEVQSLYLMSGGFDFMILIRGKNIKEVAFFVSDKLSPIHSVISTATHFVLKNYKDHYIVLHQDENADERMIVSP